MAGQDPEALYLGGGYRKARRGAKPGGLKVVREEPGKLRKPQASYDGAFDEGPLKSHPVSLHALNWAAVDTRQLRGRNNIGGPDPPLSWVLEHPRPQTQMPPPGPLGGLRVVQPSAPIWHGIATSNHPSAEVLVADPADCFDRTPGRTTARLTGDGSPADVILERPR